MSGCNNTEEKHWQGIEPDAVRPTAQQVQYQRKEKIAFIHFGVNTFTNREWGTGREDPAVFNPTHFDADQWARVLSENGFETLILTAKHHDGFCLWPSAYTEHDIAASPYRGGEGDMVGEVAAACKKYGLDFGVYLSPWDMHEPSYGTPAYNRYYKNQLQELLTNYGSIAEVWFDGAKGEDARDMRYDFAGWWAAVRSLQPGALIFSDAGPDIRWIGNEHGFAGRTNWSTIDRDSVTIGKAGQGPYLNTGQRGGPDWVAGECDVSIRPGWFYHPGQDGQVKSVAELTEIYMKSVGRNCTLLLNIPPDTTGRLHATDVRRLEAFTDTLQSLFEDNRAHRADVRASSSGDNTLPYHVLDDEYDTFWVPEAGDERPQLLLRFDRPETFDLVDLQEFIPAGQRVAGFAVDARSGGPWRTIARETTIGHRRIIRLDDPVTARELRIRFTDTDGRPLINSVRLYHGSD